MLRRLKPACCAADHRLSNFIFCKVDTPLNPWQILSWLSSGHAGGRRRRQEAAGGGGGVVQGPQRRDHQPGGRQADDRCGRGPRIRQGGPTEHRSLAWAAPSPVRGGVGSSEQLMGMCPRHRPCAFIQLILSAGAASHASPRIRCATTWLSWRAIWGRRRARRGGWWARRASSPRRWGSLGR